MNSLRTLDFANEDQVLADIARLRPGYTQGGNWSLAQICWHLAYAAEKNLRPPEPMDLEPTEEQKSAKAKFIDYIVANRKPPEWATTTAPDFIPPPTANEADIERFVAIARRIKAYPHPKVMLGRAGPVTIAEFRAWFTTHCARHLGFLSPKFEKRALSFQSVDDVKADIAQLRAGKYIQLGNWTLSQNCSHLQKAIDAQLAAPVSPATEEQLKNRPMLVKILATRQFPEGMPAPDFVQPGTDNPADIDALLKSLDRAASHPAEQVCHRRFGPIPTAEWRKLMLIHCGHHLGHLIPTN